MAVFRPIRNTRIRFGCAEWLQNKLNAIGLKAEQHATPGHPIIVARGPHKEGRPTVLIYGHYDVQPVDPLDLWHRPPFNPGIENGILTARGASDNKGQIFAHILGLEQTMKEKGDLPVNLILVIEGEEEIGSPNLAPFLDAHREALACDVVAISDSSMVAPGHPTFTYGLRGLAAVEVTVTGPDHDLHSGVFGGAVENPATVLARLIAGPSRQKSEGDARRLLRRCEGARAVGAQGVETSPASGSRIAQDDRRARAARGKTLHAAGTNLGATDR